MPKGIYNHEPCPKETRKKISESLTGRKLTKEHKRHIKENHWSKNGYISWNTGLTKEIDNRVKKHGKLMKKIWNKPEYIQLAKDRRAKIICPIKDTYIEVKIQNFLRLLHIEFMTHYYILEITHSYQCDILIPSMNLIIETDGCYWHGCKICNKKFNNHQLKQIKKDKIRTKELRQKGFKVIRIWEHDIKKMKLNDFKERMCVASDL